MSTVSELDDILRYSIADPNSQSWSQTQRVDKLNEAQIELVNRVVAKAIFNHKVYDLLSEIQEEETGLSINTTGYDLTTTTNRDYLSGGIIQVKCTLSSLTRYPKEISVAQLGETVNRYKVGDNENPLRYVWANRLFLLVSTGSYPVSSSIFYIGRPYTLGITSSGSGKSTVVSTPEINVSMHQVIAQMAKVKLLAMRAEQRDLVEIQVEQQSIERNVNSLIEGIIAKPHDSPPKGGEYLRRIGKSDGTQKVPST